MQSSPGFSLLNVGVYALLFCFALTVTFGRNYTGMVRYRNFSLANLELTCLLQSWLSTQ